MKKNRILGYLTLVVLLASCSKGNQFTTDKKYMQVVENDLQSKIALIDRKDVFPIFDTIRTLTQGELQALKFLYAYMPLGDVVDYPTDFYIENIRQTFKTREQMPWGNDIPDEVFRHFVLPIRVNNENLDRSRMVFFDELKERVRNLPLREAILEVNLWCHEKVSYQPSDARTSSPLASVCTAYGRCGEESTFTVAALRSVGIPARQVYTPRWAHTDDNHAWVEAWADGKWFYLGACEPAPVLNMGWFDGPAKRALLLHTKVFGRYNGPEEIMQQTNCYAEINVTSNYAPVAKASVKVVDINGNPVADAKVEFGIYNYAEFYTVLSATTSSQGIASITTGKGDISVWASKDKVYGLRTISVGTDEEFTLSLEFQIGDSFSKKLDITPPIEINSESNVSQALVDATNIRLAKEDSIRNAYISTFIQHHDAVKFAQKLSSDTVIIPKYLKASRGNWREISKFLESVEKDKLPVAITLLGLISEKDLRDTPASVLLDHFNNSGGLGDDFFNRYVLNPRVDFEMLSPYRSWFIENVSPHILIQARPLSASIIELTRRIVVSDDYNPQRIPISPVGVYRLGVADKKSRDIFFVALCRSLGIPARKETVTGQVQYFEDSEWQSVYFDDQSVPMSTKKSKVLISYQPSQTLENPHYDTHFTISKIENGKMNRLNFRTTEGSRSAVTWKSTFTKPVELDEGNYLLISGTRMASGKVLAQVVSFNVVEGKTEKVNLEMRNDKLDIQVVGIINPETKFQLAQNSEVKSIQDVTGKGYFALAIMGAGQEPSNHATRDFIRLKSDFEEWGRPLLLLYGDNSQFARFQKDGFSNLPSTIVYGIDNNAEIAKILVKELKLSSDKDLPIVIIADSFGKIVFVSQGYKIGLGDQMMKIIRSL